ncbi:MAG: hypothetical protein ACU0DK_03240 [Pseudooceanicola sp.]
MADLALGRTHSFRPLVLAAICAVFAMSALIGGWGFGVDPLVRIRPGYFAMVPTTAIAMTALAAAIAFGMLSVEGQRRILVNACIGLAVALVLVNAFIELVTGIRGLDGVLLGARLGDDGMAIATGLGILLCAWCIRPVAASHDSETAIPLFVAIPGLSTGAAVVCAYLQDGRQLFGLPGFDGMSMNTAICFVMLFSAVLFQHAALREEADREV